MKRAMNESRSKRGDVNRDRLFFLLEDEGGLAADNYRFLKKNVAVVDIGLESMLLKGYTSERKAMQQIILLQQLRRKGFKNIPSFLVFPAGQWTIPAEGSCWTISRYIKESGEKFSYRSAAGRREGLELLKSFHEKAYGLPQELVAAFPEFSLYEKWALRYQEFQHSAAVTARWIGRPAVDELLSLGKVFFRETDSRQLQEMEKEARTAGCFIHGDTVHHNFLRTSSGSLYLIDFDLAAPAPPAYDYLQYLNRTLPHCNWNISEYENSLGDLIHEKWFLLALLYPADLYREWNRFFRSRSNRNEAIHLRDFTLRELSNRKEFVRKTIREI